MEPEINAAALPVEQVPAENYPFWKFVDVAFFFAIAFPCLVMGGVMVKAVIWLLRLHVHSKALELLPAQFLGYGFLFLALYLLLKMHYGRPFWQSLRWIPARISVAREVMLGFLLAIAVASLGALLQTPDVANPMKDLLLSDRTSMLLMAVFATTLGPVCEELAFRGFLQPLLVRSLGPVLGILLASVPFGLLHLQQYAWSWRHVLLITLAGVAFGWMRQISGSTKASAVMHAAYNLLFFVGALLAQGNKLPTTW
jgi:uncharacterized protein